MVTSDSQTNPLQQSVAVGLHLWNFVGLLYFLIPNIVLLDLVEWPTHVQQCINWETGKMKEQVKRLVKGGSMLDICRRILPMKLGYTPTDPL